MDIALLYLDGCPHAQVAEANLLAALADVATSEVVVRKQLVDTIEDAERVGFLGSPTILIYGHDAFVVPDAIPGLSCRVYATDSGLAGTPTVTQLRDALTATPRR